MSRFHRWSLWIGLGLIVVAVICRALDLIPAAVIAGILGLLGVGFVVYSVVDDAIDGVLERAELRRRAARARRERGES